MAAYRRVYDSHHLQADCQELGSAPEPYARLSSMGCLFYTPVNFRSTGTGVLCQLSLDQRTRRSSQRLSELSQISASRVDLENTTNQTRSLAKIAQRTDINIPDRSTVRHDGEGPCTISSQIHLFSLTAIRGGVLE